MDFTSTIGNSNYIPVNPELLGKLKERAQASNRSLVDFVEGILRDAVYHEPNDETIAAMEEVRTGEKLETLDLDHFDEYVKSL
jgi:hypothetical protein